MTASFSLSSLPGPALPPEPVVLSSFRRCLVGWSARHALGARRLHLPPEMLVEATPDAIAGATPSADHADIFELDGWHLRLAPEALEARLEARVIPADSLGVQPDGALLDPLGAVGELRAAEISAGALADASVADPDLLVRIVGIGSELACRVEPAALDAIAEQAHRVLRADRRRLRDALTHLLMGRRPAGALTLLQRTGLLAFTLPEVSALVGFHKSSRFHHKDVWDHTRIVVRQAIPRPHLRWAALLHDIGKTHTRGYGPGKKVSFLRHDELGAVMFDGIAARLQFPEALAWSVRGLILHHLRANLYDPKWTDAAIRRFAADIGPHLDDLIHLSRADVTSRRPGRRREAIANLHALRSRLDAQRDAVVERPSVPKGLGKRIIEDLGVPPGPEVGRLRRLCEAAVADGRLPVSPTADACLAFLSAERGGDAAATAHSA
jgi:poly(A) polymerase